MEEVSESREIIRQIKNDMKLLMEGKKDRLVTIPLILPNFIGS